VHNLSGMLVMEIKFMFEALSRVQPSRLQNLLEFSLSEYMPRKSKALITNLIKDVSSVKEPRLLVITGHLYFDYILEKMLDKEPHSLNKQQRESFHAKLEFLNTRSKFDHQTYNGLKAINKLRNSFAHNIFYDLTKWEPTTIPFVQIYNLRIPKRKDLLRTFNIVLLRLSFLAIFDALIQSNSWLYLEDIPKS
jgi:hypothetical protein